MSCDCPIGCPTDVIEYSLLVHMLAHVSGLKPGKLTHCVTNWHVYENQMEVAKEHLKRNNRLMPNSRNTIGHNF